MRFALAAAVAFALSLLAGQGRTSGAKATLTGSGTGPFTLTLYPAEGVSSLDFSSSVAIASLKGPEGDETQSNGQPTCSLVDGAMGFSCGGLFTDHGPVKVAKWTFTTKTPMTSAPQEFNIVYESDFGGNSETLIFCAPGSNRVLNDGMPPFPAGSPSCGLAIIAPSLPGKSAKPVDVTNRTVTAVVGEHLTLEARLIDGGPFGPAAIGYWEGPTWLARRYEASLEKASATPVKATDLEGKRRISFYVTRPGTYTISVHSNTLDESAQTTLDVVAPDVTQLDVLPPGHLKIEDLPIPHHSRYYQVHGTSRSKRTTNPFAYVVTASLPRDVPSGRLAAIQLITRRALDNGCSMWGSDEALDTTPGQTSYFYGAGGGHTVTLDPGGPARSLGNADDPALAIEVGHGPYSDNVTLQTYIVFMPDGGIPVALKGLVFHYQYADAWLKGSKKSLHVVAPPTVQIVSPFTPPANNLGLVLWSSRSINHASPCAGTKPGKLG